MVFSPTEIVATIILIHLAIVGWKSSAAWVNRAIWSSKLVARISWLNPHNPDICLGFNGGGGCHTCADTVWAQFEVEEIAREK